MRARLRSIRPVRHQALLHIPNESRHRRRTHANCPSPDYYHRMRITRWSTRSYWSVSLSHAASGGTVPIRSRTLYQYDYIPGRHLLRSSQRDRTAVRRGHMGEAQWDRKAMRGALVAHGCDRASCAGRASAENIDFRTVKRDVTRIGSSAKRPVAACRDAARLE